MQTLSQREILVAETNFADCLPPGFNDLLPNYYHNLLHANSSRNLLELAGHAHDYLTALTANLSTYAHPACDVFAATLTQLSNALSGRPTPPPKGVYSLIPQAPSGVDHGVVLQPLREFTVYYEDECAFYLQPVLPVTAQSPKRVTTTRATGIWRDIPPLPIDPLLVYVEDIAIVPHSLLDIFAQQLTTNTQAYRPTVNAVWSVHDNRKDHSFDQAVLFTWAQASALLAAHT